MKINYILSESKEHTCVALGFFDGIHLGHHAVISNTIKKACLTDTIPTVLTFSKHPKNIIKNTKIKNIITQNQKENLLCNMGISLLYCIDFSEVMNLSPNEFIKRILIHTLHAKYVFCGFNYRFGKGASAGYMELTSICKNCGIEVYTIDPVSIENTIVSSTNIRNLIEIGDIKTANKMLGHPFGFDFPAVHNDNLDENIIFKPTVNQVFPNDFIIPKYGVYKSYTIVNGYRYDSISSVGKNQSVSNSSLPICKTQLLNYKGNLDCKNVEVFLTDFLYNEKK